MQLARAVLIVESGGALTLLLDSRLAVMHMLWNGVISRPHRRLCD